MSELKDTAAAFVLIDKKFDQIDARVAELEKFAAVLDRGQQTLNSQIDIFRAAINEGFDRMRRELGIGNRRR